VAPRDPAALAGVLAELAADPGQAARLGAAAAVDVRARFGRPRLLDEIQALYDRLLA
jgi:glycosyltransferase involved in cell wall biosynthesis